MQKILLLFSISFGVPLSGVCQTTTIVNLPVFASGHTYNELIAQNRILDEVTQGEDLLFLCVKLENDRIGEYYKYDDNSFVFRIKHHDTIVEEGVLKMNMNDHIFSDTSTLFDPVTYEPSVYIYFVREAQRQGKWTEVDVLGDSAVGNYEDGVRSGIWRIRKEGTRSSVHYEEEQIIGLPSPSKTEVLAYLDWLLENDYQWCNQISHYVKPETSPYKRTWRLNVEGANLNCLDLGVFSFEADGTFVYTEVNASLEERKRAEGQGAWKLEEGSQAAKLLLVFSDGQRDELLFSYFGKEHMEWRWERGE